MMMMMMIIIIMVKGCRPDNGKLSGSMGYDVLRRMQKAMLGTISSSLNIVRTFKASVT